MWREIAAYIQANWVAWLFAGMGVAMGYMTKKIRDQQKESRAIAEGVRSLLRESIVGNYNKYQDRRCCPIYAKESIRKAYKAYHDLGGNDIATELYEKLLKMPEEPAESEG